MKEKSLRQELRDSNNTIASGKMDKKELKAMRNEYKTQVSSQTRKEERTKTRQDHDKDEELRWGLSDLGMFTALLGATIGTGEE